MGTILGSLAAGVVMLYLNYLALGRANLARTVSSWGVALFITMLIIAAFVPSNGIAALTFTLIQAGVAYFLAEKLQGDMIRYHRAQSGSMHSNVRAAGVGFLTGLALFCLLMVGTALWMLATGANLDPEAAARGV